MWLQDSQANLKLANISETIANCSRSPTRVTNLNNPIFMKSMFAYIFQLLYRFRHGITLSNAKFETLVGQVNDLKCDTAEQSDAQLKDRLSAIRMAVKSGQMPDEFIVEGMAIIREAAFRSVQLKPYDVQVLAAFAMNANKCVEMQTGEGKTLAAAMVGCWRAIIGQQVHILTFNDYLAARDAEWMGPLFDFCNVSVGSVQQGMKLDQRQAGYRCEVTYVTAKEAGFDFLRDQLAKNDADMAQCGHEFAIVDEADSILIDEARIPLVIATESETDDFDLHEFATIVQRLRLNAHYEIRANGRNVTFTDSGIRWLETELQVDELYSDQHCELLARLNLALQADVLLEKDIDYIVRDNQIELIDEFTGRVAENRKWPGGLQASLEAKEGLTIQPQGRILNSVTLQHFIELYSGVAGMTGTAVEGTEEFDEFYKLKVLIIPPNRPCIRQDHNDRIFATKTQKMEALRHEVTQQHALGRPVLIGTASVDESQLLAIHLKNEGVPCRVLNAANDHLEAEIIAEAGALNAVTISTNMAGRGTDICLGGSNQSTRAEVVNLGGLYVIGTNRNESRRIDNQLRGRAGRQGDPGESRYFVSLEDDLIAKYRIAEHLDAADAHELQAADAPQTASQIAHVQRIIEGECFEIRRTLRMYSFLLELQRRTIAKYRQELLLGTRTPAGFRKLHPERRQEVIDKYGQDVVEDSERRVTLIHLDWCWSDHLANASELREGIYLVSLGGFNAFDAFNKEMNLGFEAFLAEVEQKSAATLTTAKWTADGVDLEQEGLTGPSSTWTFMINDNPRGAMLSQLMNGLLKRIKRTFAAKADK